MTAAIRRSGRHFREGGRIALIEVAISQSDFSAKDFRKGPTNQKGLFDRAPFSNTACGNRPTILTGKSRSKKDKAPMDLGGQGMWW